jgi:hypothetical protein
MIYMKRRVVVVLARSFCVALLATLAAHAGQSSGTPESVALQNMQAGMQLFEREHGYAVTNWSQVDEAIGLRGLNQGLRGTRAFPIQDQYVFLLHERVQMPPPYQGTVLLIRANPGRNSADERGRYMLYRGPERLGYAWCSENKVQAMLAAAGVTNLSSNSPTVRTPTWPPLASWLVVALVLAVAAGVVYVLARRSGKRPSSQE